jgi:hypothetical protein
LRYLAASCCVQSVSIGNMCSELSLVVWRRSSGVGKPRERGSVARKADAGKSCGGRAVQWRGMAAREGNAGARLVWEGSEARLRSAGAAQEGDEALHRSSGRPERCGMAARRGSGVLGQHRSRRPGWHRSGDEARRGGEARRGSGVPKDRSIFRLAVSDRWPLGLRRKPAFRSDLDGKDEKKVTT